MGQSVQCIFESALSHTRRSDASEIRKVNSALHTLEQIRLWTSFELSPVSVNTCEIKINIIIQSWIHKSSKQLASHLSVLQGSQSWDHFCGFDNNLDDDPTGHLS